MKINDKFQVRDGAGTAEVKAEPLNVSASGPKSDGILDSMRGVGFRLRDARTYNELVSQGGPENIRLEGDARLVSFLKDAALLRAASTKNPNN